MVHVFSRYAGPFLLVIALLPKHHALFSHNILHQFRAMDRALFAHNTWFLPRTWNQQAQRTTLWYWTSTTAVTASEMCCFAMCCNVLQCVAVRCSALQYGAVCCRLTRDIYTTSRVTRDTCRFANVLYPDRSRPNTPQWWWEAVCCSVLQCVALCCSILAIYDVGDTSVLMGSSVLQCVAVCCSVLQCAAILLRRMVYALPQGTSVMELITCTATILQHTATILHHTATHCNAMSHIINEVHLID